MSADHQCKGFHAGSSRKCFIRLSAGPSGVLGVVYPFCFDLPSSVD